MIAATGSTLFWYLARGFGLAALVVLTFSMVLGITASVRWTSQRWPRFVIELLHRNLSVLGLALIVVHVNAVIIDGFAPIGWKDVVAPFASAYRPVWLGLGAAAFDVLLAVVITSVFRRQIGHRTWRTVHWLSYLCWPLVVVHGFGTGTDPKAGFVLALYVACIAAVIAAAWWRLASAGSEHRVVRAVGALVSVTAPVVLVAWLVSGPLTAGWARRAGTPSNLLAGRSAAIGTTPATATPTYLTTPPFSALLRGSITRSPSSSSSTVASRLAGSLSGGSTGVLDVSFNDQRLEGGGVRVVSSTVMLGPIPDPELYEGSVVRLRQGRVIVADVEGGGLALRLTIHIERDHGRRFSGTVNVQPIRGGGG